VQLTLSYACGHWRGLRLPRSTARPYRERQRKYRRWERTP
jgi:hypothetical protein